MQNDRLKSVLIGINAQYEKATVTLKRGYPHFGKLIVVSVKEKA